MLRFLSLYALLLLIIDPQFESVEYTTVKPVLAVAIDNSASIDFLAEKDEVEEALRKIQSNTDLNERFNIDYYQFGTDLETLDSLSFTEQQSDLSKPLLTFASIYKNAYAPVLITDGNATIGADYEYNITSSKQPVYYLAVGDTSRFEDLKMEQINVNRYAYLNNKFPVEIHTSYSGRAEKSTELSVFSGNKKVFSKKLDFNSAENGKVTNFYLPANTVGFRQYTARITPFEGEKNTINNEKSFGVEVIDQRAKVAVVYSYLHPDLGTLKKAIESNELRDAELINISDFQISTLEDYELVILFEPTRAFSKVYSGLEKLNRNRFTIAAAKTDYNALNAFQATLKKRNTNQVDEVRPELNLNFTAFLMEDIGYSDFPPLKSAFGPSSLNGKTEVLLYKNIAGVQTQEPLLAVSETEGRREVLLLATGIWKWRAQSYLSNQSFEPFDNFIDKLLQYCISTSRKDKLRLDYESFYYGSQNAMVRAQYVDDNYNFDNRASLMIEVVNKTTKKSQQFPMVARSNFFEVKLNILEAGSYDFTVQVEGGETSATGAFTIIPYDIERQAQNAAWPKLKRAAQASQGDVQTIDNLEVLIDKLLSDNSYIPIQRSVKKTVSLIDFHFLLFIIVACLAIEWFIRKYNGLI